MNLTCLIPLFVLVATNCHSAIAKEGQARRLEEWENPRMMKSPSKGTNPSKGCKATSPSKGSKGTNPSKGSTKAPKSSKGKASTVTTSCDDDDETPDDNTSGQY
jgi:hypothetical protein|eukprot:scaffold815_cov273-Chaetoceros_neogracile.AAC.22